MGAAKPPQSQEHEACHREPAKRIRIYVNRLAHNGHQPAYEAIVSEARRHGLAGVTVINATMGFGASGKIHQASIASVEKDQPVIVDIIDEPSKIESFLPVLTSLMSGGIVTVLEMHTVA